MLARAHLNLLARSFKVKASAYARSMRVFWHECEAHIGCHWPTDPFQGVAFGVYPASRTRRGSFPSARTTFEFAYCNALVPMLGGFPVAYAFCATACYAATWIGLLLAPLLRAREGV